MKLFNFMISLKDSYYYEYEINNHNLLVYSNQESEDYELCLIN